MYVLTQRFEPSTYAVFDLHEESLLTLFVEVEGGLVAHIFVVDEPNLNLFQTDQTFGYQGLGGVASFHGTINLPHPGPWRLILENRNTLPITVQLGHQGI